MPISTRTQAPRPMTEPEPLYDRPFLNALRSYLRHREDGRRDSLAYVHARRELVQFVPRRGRWFLCELEGRSYAVRVLKSGRIEVMRSIFDSDSDCDDGP